MSLLFAIPHYYYFEPQAGAAYQSLAADPLPRITALTACLAALHHLFGHDQAALDIAGRQVVPANAELRHDITIVVCTIGDRHLLARLPIGGSAFEQRDCPCEPKLLGFECQRILQESLGRYDYYCYLEDDLVIHDPLFFAKLSWFTSQTSEACLLQPNRFETPENTIGRKLYVDGDVRETVTHRFRDPRSLEQRRLEALGTELVFRMPLNPHAGCFFLSAAQMGHWSQQPWFGDRDTSFIGPLESAATLGVLRTFRIYKPALPNAAFLEVQHYGQGYLGYADGGFPPPEE